MPIDLEKYKLNQNQNNIDLEKYKLKAETSEKSSPSMVSKLAGFGVKVLQIPQTVATVGAKTLGGVAGALYGGSTDVAKDYLKEAGKELFDIPSEVSRGYKEGFWAESKMATPSKALGLDGMSGLLVDMAGDPLNLPIFKIASKLNAPLANKVNDVLDGWAGLNNQTKTILRETSQKIYDKYIDITRKAIEDPRAITPLENVGNRAKEALKVMKTKLNLIGGEKEFITKEMGNMPVEGAINKTKNFLRDKISNLGLDLTGKGEFKFAEGRIPKTFNQTDMNTLKEVDDILSEVGKRGETFQRIDDAVDAIQDIVFRRKKAQLTVPINTKVESIIKSTVSELNNILKKAGGETYKAKNTEYADLVKTVNYFNKKLGEEGKQAGSFVKRFFSPSDAGTKQLFDTVKNSTGIDLAQEATLAKFLMETLGDVRQKSLLDKVIGLDKGGLIRESADWLSKKALRPTVRAEKQLSDYAPSLKQTLFGQPIKQGIEGLETGLVSAFRKRD